MSGAWIYDDLYPARLTTGRSAQIKTYFEGISTAFSLTYTAAQTDALTWNTSSIVNNAVTFAKFQTIGTMKVVGRTASGTGNVSEVPILDEDNMVSDSATALATQQSIKAYVGAFVNQTANIADDAVTNDKLADNAADTAQIVNSAVTLAKMANLANMRVIGNVSGGSAAPAAVTILDEDNMASDSATALATQQSIKAYVLATAFNAALPSQTGNANKVPISDGTNAVWGLVSLTANITGTLGIGNGGTGATTAAAARAALLPTFTGNGNKFARVNAGATDIEYATISSLPTVVTATKVDTFSLGTTNTWTDITDLSVSITPSANTSRVFVVALLTLGHSTATETILLRLVRDSTAIGVGTTAGSRIAATTQWHPSSNVYSSPATIAFVDSPATTSATTYKVQMLIVAATGYVNRTGTDADAGYTGRSISTITVMEVAA